MSAQLSLLSSPQPIIPAADPTVVREAKPRLSRQCREIVALLERGPATNRELSQIAQRFGARLKDLRAAGYVIETTPVSHERGVFLYTLKEAA